MNLESGYYRVEWLVLDEDGHVVEIQDCGGFEVFGDWITSNYGAITDEIKVGPLEAAHWRLLSMSRSIYERLVRDSDDGVSG